MKRYILEMVVFICGADLMMLEMVGSRIIAPYLGTSIYVWTSLIGVILGFLSLGYWAGGKIADRHANPRILASVILLSAILVMIISVTKDYILENILSIFTFDLRITTTIAALLLFGPPSFFLGIVSPYAAKLKINSLHSSGSTVGTLYAISTIGSIFGTFLAGFFLIALFGNTKILIFLAITLVLSALLLYPEKSWVKFLILLLLIAYYPFSNQFSLRSKQPYIQNEMEFDTNYNHVKIFDYTGPPLNTPLRVMQINNEISSTMLLNTSELPPGHNRFYRQLSQHFNPEIKSALMIGGAGYDYPKEFLRQYQEATLDVVEIDPQVTELAKKYFRLVNHPRLKIFHEDGRIFLNRNQKKYDAIFVDAFNSYVVPHHLTTRETVKKIYDSLTFNGVALVNLKSGLAGRNLRFLKALKTTYNSVFPQVYIFPVADPQPTEQVQNIILVALKSLQKPSLRSNDIETTSYLQHLFTHKLEYDQPILTDEFAPVESYQSYGVKEISKIFQQKLFSFFNKLKRLIAAFG